MIQISHWLTVRSYHLNIVNVLYQVADTVRLNRILFKTNSQMFVFYPADKC